MSKLVIVESPAKAKTIKKYLGSDYNVVASMGHVRDLPKARLSVDVKNKYEPKYAVIKGKEKLVKDLQKKAEKSDGVYLATDPDREGEAISWHLAFLLGLDLDEQNRVEFTEITKSGIKSGMEHPRALDIDLVDAQQARRILDRLVGYKLSPFVSQKIRRGLSAGRVQSVALRIIVDREEEIRKFKPEEYWSIISEHTTQESKRKFTANFHGDKKGKMEIKNEKEAKAILDNVKDADFIVSDVKHGKRRRNPSPPFITSTLQQDASRKLGFQSRRTMQAAQQLYEGVDIDGLGTTGLITYMRTDSLRISQSSVDEAVEYIKETYGEKYLPPKPRFYKSKKAQDGHEAIRPTMPSLAPEKIKDNLTSDQYRLYKLIWERFTACQMATCVHKTTRADISANDYIFKASGYVVEFDGFTVLYTESKDEEEEKAKQLPTLKKDAKLNLVKITPNQHFTNPPPRYNEASLIKALEENGIGRPSTYASTITTITSREYVKREGRTFIPTELGEVSTNLMKERFPNIVDVKFTAKMEDDLDGVEKGKSNWVDLLDDFYLDFDKTLETAKEEMKGVKIQLKEDQTDIICDKCGKNMVVKVGRYGKFIACPGYPDCKNIKPYIEEIGIDCPKCEDGKIIIRKTKRGKPFYGCSNYPKCDYASWNEPINERCPQCNDLLYKRKGRNQAIFCSKEGCGYKKPNEN